MIARNEEQFLEACLESVRGVADEIILVDTGSEDATVAIAQRFGAKVLRYKWHDDFAAARNQSLQAATGQWLLVLDADERLDPQAGPGIRQALEQGGFETGLIHFVNMGDDGPCGREWLAARLFQHTPGIHFIGRIHEQIVHRLDRIRHRIIDGVVYHYGYQASVFLERQKRDRNARLLDQALNDPEARDPLLRTNYLYHHANLATNGELLRRYQDYLAYIHQQWPENPPAAPWITGGMAEYARLLADVGRYGESRRLARELLERHGESPMMRYLLARAAAAEGDLEAAEAELARVLAPKPQISPAHLQYTQDLGLVIGRARFLLGLIREKQGQLEEAVGHYRAAAKEEPEQDLMARQLVCAQVRLARYPEALETLERCPALAWGLHPGTDCLGLVLALLTRSVARLGFWGERVRQAGEGFPAGGRILRRIEQLGPHWRYRLEDFPEVASAILPQAEPGALLMPQTARKTHDI